MGETTTSDVTSEEEKFLEIPAAVVKKKLTLPQKIRHIWDNITIEPMLAAFVIPCALSVLATQNLALEKACRVNLNYSDEICDALTRRETTNYTNEEKMVQQLVAGMAKWKTILQSGLPCLMIMFWGSWSDRHGRRKPCMLIPVLGELLTAVSLILCVYFKSLPMEVPAIVESIFPALAGGWSTMMMGAFSYVADVTTDEERTVRIGMVNLCINLGIPIGMAFSGIFLKMFGFYGVFSITASLHFGALIYGLCVVKESRMKDERPKLPPSNKGVVADFFDKRHVIDTFKVAFKSDNKQRRLRVIMLFIVLVVVEGPMFGEMSVFYLFTRYRFNFDEVEYSIFSAYAMGTGLLGVMFSVGVLSHRLKIADALVGMLSSLSKILSSFVYAFAVTRWQLYLGPLVEVLNGTSFIAMRSIATKLVGSDEFGKVNSLFGVVAALVPVVYTPMYASMYIATLHILPGAFFLLGGAMTMPAVGIFIWLYVVQKKDQKQLDGKDEEMKIMGDQHGRQEVTAGTTMFPADLNESGANSTPVMKVSTEALAEATVVNGSVAVSAKDEVPTNQNGINK